MQMEMCFFNCVTRFLFFMYGTLGPAYHTYKTLNTGDDAFLAWAKYWIVYAFLITIEVLADTFISWLPLYTPTKLLLVLWIVLSAPAANVWMFDAIVRPVLSRRQEQIDNFLNRGKDKFLGDIVNLMKWLVVRGRAFVVPFITQMWIRGIMKSPEDDLAAAIGEDNESHEGSEQTSAKNLSICSSPLASSNFANDDSDAFQLSVSKASTHLHHHSSHSLNDLPRNKLVQSPIFMQRKVSRKVGKRLTEEAHLRSGSTLSLPKEEFFDDVEDLLAKTQNETLSQDLHEQRQHIHRRRLTAP